MTESNKRVMAAIQDHLYNFEGYSKGINPRFLSYENGIAAGDVELKPEFLNPMGTAHGGFICTLIDIFGGIPIAMHSGKDYDFDERMSTLSMNVNFLGRNTQNIVKWDAHVVKYGNHIRVSHVNLYDGDNGLIADGVATYYVVGKK